MGVGREEEVERERRWGETGYNTLNRLCLPPRENRLLSHCVPVALQINLCNCPSHLVEFLLVWMSLSHIRLLKQRNMVLFILLIFRTLKFSQTLKTWLVKWNAKFSFYSDFGNYISPTQLWDSQVSYVKTSPI